MANHNKMLCIWPFHSTALVLMLITLNTDHLRSFTIQIRSLLTFLSLPMLHLIQRDSQTYKGDCVGFGYSIR